MHFGEILNVLASEKYNTSSKVSLSLCICNYICEFNVKMMPGCETPVANRKRRFRHVREARWRDHPLQGGHLLLHVCQTHRMLKIIEFNSNDNLGWDWLILLLICLLGLLSYVGLKLYQIEFEVVNLAAPGTIDTRVSFLHFYHPPSSWCRECE